MAARAHKQPHVRGYNGSSSRLVTMKIRIDVDGTPLTATLDDTATSRDFISLLPLTRTLEDYNAPEKISDLPKKLQRATTRV